MSEIREEDRQAAMKIVGPFMSTQVGMFGSALVSQIAQLRANAFSAGLEAAASKVDQLRDESKDSKIRVACVFIAEDIRSLSPNVAERKVSNK